MSNRRKPRKPWLRLPHRPNVADLAWTAHRNKVLRAEAEKNKDNIGWLRSNYQRLLDDRS